MKTIKFLAMLTLCLAASFGEGYLKALNRAADLRADLRVELIARGLAGYNHTTGVFELGDLRPEPLPVSDMLPLPTPLPEVKVTATKKSHK